jgi:hypothetical protein
MMTTMRIRRGLLFSGLFLIPVGGLTLLVRGGYLDADALRDAWRLWPLVLVGLGLAILLGRTRGAAVGTAISALVLGLIVGGGFASGSWIGFGVCSDSSADLQLLDRTGEFAGPSTVRLDLRCGSVDLATEAGTGWHLTASYAGPAPIVDATTGELDLKVTEGNDVRRQEWTVRVAPDRLSEVELDINAANGTLRFDGATLTSLDADANASDITLAAGAATVGRLDVSVNAGRARVTLGDGPVAGDITVNAGTIDLCVPPGSGLRITTNDQLTFATNLGDRGLTRSGTLWVRAGSGSAGVIALSVEGNAATFNLDPSGGCG